MKVYNTKCVYNILIKYKNFVNLYVMYNFKIEFYKIKFVICYLKNIFYFLFNPQN